MSGPLGSTCQRALPVVFVPSGRGYNIRAPYHGLRKTRKRRIKRPSKAKKSSAFHQRRRWGIRAGKRTWRCLGVAHDNVIPAPECGPTTPRTRQILEQTNLVQRAVQGQGVVVVPGALVHKCLPSSHCMETHRPTERDSVLVAGAIDVPARRSQPVVKGGRTCRRWQTRSGRALPPRARRRPYWDLSQSPYISSRAALQGDCREPSNAQPW